MKIKKIIISLLCIFFIYNTAYSYWVWTPITKKWTNPKTDTKDTPKEQFKWAKEFYDNRKYKRAIKEFRKLIRSFPNSSDAAESQYFIGQSLIAMKKHYKAYLEYQKTIEKYPGTNRIEDILAKELEIANYFYNKEPIIIAGVKIPKNYEYCILIYEQIIKNAPYSKNADQAQFFLAESYRIAGKFDEAIKSYNKLVERYPESKYFTESKYKIAYCMSNDINKETQASIDKAGEAIKEFEQFTQRNGDSNRVKEAKEEMNKLINFKAKQLLDTGIFYEKQKKYDAALIYYKETVNNYAKTNYGQIALKKIEQIKGKNNKLKEKIKK